MPARPTRPKDLARLINDCESHLKFLEEALLKHAQEPDRYKQIAGELRVLVCAFGRNKALLLDLLDQFPISYFVQPLPDLPFPIPMIGELHKPPEVDFAEMTQEEIWAYHRSNAKQIPLREFIDNGLAIYIAPYELSNKELIRLLAEKSGVSHEDRDIDDAQHQLDDLYIVGYVSYGLIMQNLGELVLNAGKFLIYHLVQKEGYQPHYFKNLHEQK